VTSTMTNAKATTTHLGLSGPLGMMLRANERLKQRAGAGRVARRRTAAR
jgi:hypothetical protein